MTSEERMKLARVKNGGEGKQRSVPVPETEATLLLQPSSSSSSPEAMLTPVLVLRRRRQLLVHVLAVLFGVGAWVGVNGLFVELPLLVQTAPEAWTLPSYLAVIVQLANLGPLLYSLAHRLFPGRVRDSSIVYVILCVGCASMLLTAFVHGETSSVGAGSSGRHSTALLALSFFLALVGCTSSVLFMPFMRNFRETYLTSYFVGEGLSGFLPSVVALAQGVGGNPVCLNSTVDATNVTTLTPYTPPPVFSSRVFFLVLFAALVLSTVSFFLLNNLPVCKAEKVTKVGNTAQAKAEGELGPKADHHDDDEMEQEEPPQGQVFTVDSRRNTTTTTTSEEPKPKELVSRGRFVSLVLLGGWLCVWGNGVFPSVQSYSCLPYGNTAYHLAATLSSMANPLACFLGFWVAAPSLGALCLLSSLCTLSAVYVAVTALASPQPPLLGHVAGEVLVVSSWVVFTGLISYVKLSIASTLRAASTGQDRALFWCGAVQQMGSALGAVFIFFLVNFSDVFHSYDPCRR